MNIKLSLVKTTALAFGAALLMVGGVLSLLGVPGAKAETDANFNTIAVQIRYGSQRLRLCRTITFPFS